MTAGPARAEALSYERARLDPVEPLDRHAPRDEAAPLDPGAPLEEEFFSRPVNEVARDLVGCTLLFEDTGGVIIETEAYDATDPACHAYNGMTARNEPLFGPPGRAYVYLSYGIHQLLNAVAEPLGQPAAALIRALEPVSGLEAMQARRGTDVLIELCSGPGKLTQALGVGARHNGASLLGPPFALLARTGEWVDPPISADTRIGISRAAERPWRYCASGSAFLSKRVSAQAA